jgi:hypothetical protein
MSDIVIPEFDLDIDEELADYDSTKDAERRNMELE